MSEVYQNNLKIRKKNPIFRYFFGYFGLWNYVSKTLRGKGCIAPKLRGAKVEGSKTLRGKGWGVQNSAVQICLQSLPAEFWTPQPLPRGVLEQCNFWPAEFWKYSFRSQTNHTKYLRIGFYFLLFWRHSFRGQNNHKKYLKIGFSFLF